MSIWMLACPLMMMGFGGIVWLGSRLSRSRENAPFRPMCVPTMPPRLPDTDGAETPGVTTDGVVPRQG